MKENIGESAISLSSLKRQSGVTSMEKEDSVPYYTEVSKKVKILSVSLCYLACQAYLTSGFQCVIVLSDEN